MEEEAEIWRETGKEDRQREMERGKFGKRKCMKKRAKEKMKHREVLITSYHHHHHHVVKRVYGRRGDGRV